MENSFINFLIEARSNKDKNIKVSAYSQLKKYKNDNDIYLSYTVLKKLGINPQTKWDTPLGIYTYPIKEIWHNIESKKSATGVPFAQNSPYIHIIKYNGTGKFIDDISTDYNQNDLNADISKIKNLYSYVYENSKFDDMDSIIQKGIKKSHNNTPFSKFWSITQFIAKDMNFHKSHSTNVALNWANIFRKLGYTGFGDKSGSGIIHPSEPIQAVFLSTKDITVVDMIMNKEYSQRVSINSISDLTKYLPDILKTYTLNRVMTTVKENTDEYIDKFHFSKQIEPSDVLDVIKDNFDEYITLNDKNSDNYVAIKLQDPKGLTNKNIDSLYEELELYFHNSNIDMTTGALHHYYGDLYDILGFKPNINIIRNNVESIFNWIKLTGNPHV